MKGNIFINRYVMACAIAIVITLVGFICMSTLPIEQYPNIAPPTVRVSTSSTIGGEYQWCAWHDLHHQFGIIVGRCVNTGVF